LELRGGKNLCQKEYVLFVEKRKIFGKEKYVKKSISYVTVVLLENLNVQYAKLN
jgi:hypothetical protein